MSTTASTTRSGSPTTPDLPRRPTACRVGLVLGLVLLLGGTVPALDVGFDGTPWDTVVLAVGLLSPTITIAALAMLPAAWRGGRDALRVSIGLQLVAVLPAVPPFLHEPGQLPLAAPISAAIGIGLNLLSAWLISRALPSA